MSAGLHHTHAPVCPLCEQKLSQAHPDLATWFRTQVKAAHPSAHVSWSYRDRDDQEQCVLEGSSRLHYPHSEHNKTDANGNPCAHALDLFEIDENGAAKYDPMFYSAIDAMNEEKGLSIQWGGKWKTLGDGDHFQFSNT